MTDLRTLFRRNVARVAAEGRAASADLIHRLKQMSAAEFLRQPWTVIDQLTWAQYKEIVRVVAPDVKLAAGKVEVPEKEKRTVLDWWRERSGSFRSLVWTIAVTVAFMTIGLMAPWIHKATLSRAEVVRPSSWQAWPVCARLSAYTDGCVYTPTQDLNWDWAAWKLDMPVETLRRANPHLPSPFIIRGAPLLIWRGRGHLLEN